MTIPARKSGTICVMRAGGVCVAIGITVLISQALPAQSQISILQQVFFAKQLLPAMKTIGVLTNIHEKEDDLKQLILAGKSYSVTIQIYDVPLIPNVREAFQSASKAHVDLIWLLNDKIGNDKLARRLIFERSLLSKIPVYSYTKEFLREGALYTLDKDPSTGAVSILFNSRIGDLIGIKPPEGIQSKLTNFSD